MCDCKTKLPLLFGKLKGIKLVYMGDARYNMGNSLMVACSKMGLDFVACAPKKYFPDKALVEQCKEYASQSGSSITLTECKRRNKRSRCHLYRCMGIYGGTRRGVGGENSRINSLQSDKRGYE